MSNLIDLKKQLLIFIDLYYKKTGDLYKIITIINSYNFDDYFLNSKDFEIIEVSYEYNFLNNKFNNDFRIALFGLKLDFFEKFEQTFGKNFFDIDLLINFFNQAKGNLKEDFISVSLTFDKSYNLSGVKIYFDTFVKKDNKILINNYPSKFIDLVTKNSSFVLASMTINSKEILDFKIYIPTNFYLKKIADILLKENKEYQQFIDFQSFDILFRFSKDGKSIKSIKFYYELRYNEELRKMIIEKYFKNLYKNNSCINSRDEVGIDFDLKKGINKINYYIGLFKN